MVTLQRAPKRKVRTLVADSRRWDRFAPRDNDIVIATFAKCGTTWTQRIVDLLVFQSADARPFGDISPWLDSTLFHPVEEDLATLEAQTHRRYIKSHLPFDALPVWDKVKYIHVGRDGRDARLSWQNHEKGFTQEFRVHMGGLAKELAAEQGTAPAAPPPPPPEAPRDYLVQWFEDLETQLDGDEKNPQTRFGLGFFGFEDTYWQERERANLLLVHYNDLKRDLAGEMQRIADFLEIKVPASVMPKLVEAARFDSMKKDGAALLPTLDKVFDGGTNRFINKGQSGRWRECLNAGDIARYEAIMKRACTPGLAAWLEDGRANSGDPKIVARLTKAVDIKAFIDERPMAPFLWALVAMCFLIVVADGMDVAIMGFVTPAILMDWHVSRLAFGFVISAAPLGLVIGALLAGPISDRFGRKIVVAISVLVFGAFMVIAASASGPREMALLRILAGMGMGAAMPSATALLSEYTPARHRSLLITVMFSGFTLGSALIGFIAAALIPHFGWRAVLLVGGVTPLLLVPVLAVWLPESARYLALKGAAADKISKLLGRVTGAAFTGEKTFVSPEPLLSTKRPVGVLFSPGYGAITIALWLSCFMSLLVVYLLTGWLPTLMKDAGLSIAAAANVTAMFQVGATIGAILVGWAMDRTHPSRVIGAAYLAGAVLIMGLAWAGPLSAGLAVTVFAAGFCISGAQSGLNAFAPACYPTVARATGIAWMLGIGRFGSIAGSLVGGALLGQGWGFAAILGILALPALVAAIAIAFIQPAASSLIPQSQDRAGA